MGRGRVGEDFVDMGMAVVCLRIGRSCEWEEGPAMVVAVE